VERLEDDEGEGEQVVVFLICDVFAFWRNKD